MEGKKKGENVLILSELIALIPGASGCNDRIRCLSVPSSIDSIVNEIAFIFLTTKDLSEKNTAENALVSILVHKEKFARYTAYLALTRQEVIAKSSRRALDMFELRPINSSILKLVVKLDDASHLQQ